MPEIAGRNTPIELRELSRSFGSLASRMNGALEQANAAASELSRTIAERDDVIAARTAELRIVNDELRLASCTDALTGCRNYRGFAEDLTSLHRQCMDDRMPLAVVSCDIDHFKSYNDRFGHPAGDQCLQRVSAALRGAMSSPVDILARVGGEEFVALLPRLPSSAAHLVAERMRIAVMSLEIPHPDSEFRVVTISAGWAVLLPDGATPLEHVLLGSDAALYLSKQRGRNQVTKADEHLQ
jgi:diguanylate cyclase (GGDEF)-like protein